MFNIVYHKYFSNINVIITITKSDGENETILYLS